MKTALSSLRATGVNASMVDHTRGPVGGPKHCCNDYTPCLSSLHVSFTSPTRSGPDWISWSESKKQRVVFVLIRESGISPGMLKSQGLVHKDIRTYLLHPISMKPRGHASNKVPLPWLISLHPPLSPQPGLPLHHRNPLGPYLWLRTTQRLWR